MESPDEPSIRTPASAAGIAALVEDFVRNSFAVSPTDPRFGRTADLFEGGYVDSVGVTEMLVFIEEEFGVEIPEDELLSDELTTIDGISRIVERLLAA